MRKGKEEKLSSGARKSCPTFRKTWFGAEKTCLGEMSCFSGARARFAGPGAHYRRSGSCLLTMVACLFLMMMLCPLSLLTYAEEVLTDGAMTDSSGVSDAGIMTAAAPGSTVGISFSPTAGSTSLTPTTSTGQSAQVNVLATVNVANSGGYSVYIKSNTQNLVGKKSSANVIPGIQGSKTYNNLAINTWGYYAGEGTAVPEGATYKAISVTGNGDKVTENTDNKITADTKKIMLSFAAKIGDNIPADTYQNTVTMSVVSSPIQLALTDIVELQQMTSDICENTPIEPATGSSKQLKDIRDGKYYWVTKLKDNNCWMTQNLDLDLSTSKALTPDDSDVSNNWTPEYSTATTADDSTILESDTGQRSWSLGDYRITNPTIPSDCGSPKNSFSQCTSKFTSYATPVTANNDANARYIVGNHYQWNAATAGTGGSITSGQAAGSICPKGWRLPTTNDASLGTFSGLLGAYDIRTAEKATSSPVYFVRSGYVSQSWRNLLSYAGRDGAYWSSTPTFANGSYRTAYLYINSSYSAIASSTDLDRPYGMSVRCIAR